MSEIRLELAGIPAGPSKKNSKRIVGRGRSRRLLPSVAAVEFERRVRDAAQAQRQSPAPAVPTASVGVLMTHHALSGTIDICVRELDPEPTRGRNGRSMDLHGIFETVADALQGSAYADDRQVSHVELVRILD